MTADTPVPDVRELIASEFARFLREEGARDRPWDFADGLAAIIARRWQGLVDDPEQLDAWVETHDLYGATIRPVLAAVAADCAPREAS